MTLGYNKHNIRKLFSINRRNSFLIINGQMKPLFATFLHILQGHLSVTQFEIFDVNAGRYFISLYSFGRRFQIFAPKLVKDFVP